MRLPVLENPLPLCSAPSGLDAPSRGEAGGHVGSRVDCASQSSPVRIPQTLAMCITSTLLVAESDFR